jgi:branched-chain amino acid transport system substrate-binding protein
MKVHAIVLSLLCSGLLLAQDTIKIGVILPLSGNNSKIGESIVKAVNIFNKECEKGHYRHKYMVIVEDDQLAGRLTAEAVMKLIDIDHVDGLASFGSSAANVIAPRAKSAGIPHLAIATDTRVADDKFNFIHWVSPQRQAAAALDIAEKMGCKKVAMLTVRQQGYLADMEAAKLEIEKRGLILVSNEIFNPGERDFRTQLTRIRETHPEVLIPTGYSPEIEIILRQCKQLDFRPRITSMQSFDWMLNAEDAEGLYYATASMGSAEFEAHCVKLTGASGISYGVANMYDMLNMLRSSYESMDKPDHAAAAKWLANVKDFPSAMGINIDMGADGRTDPPAGYFKIVHGKPTPVSLDEVR